MPTVPKHVDIDVATFAVRCQKFRIAALVMKRTSIPLATEYATRLVHLVPGIRLDDMLAFFDFDPPESKILLQDVLSTGLVEERNGQLFLSQRGWKALSPVSDKLDLFEMEEIKTTVAFELAALTPVEESSLNTREARLIEELKLPDREKAAAAAAAASEAFDLHFQEWRGGQSRSRWLDEDARLNSIEDIQPVAATTAVFQIPIRWRPADEAGASPDFSELSSRGRPGSRNPLISAISEQMKSVVAPEDHQVAFDLLDRIDGGILRRGGVRSSLERQQWIGAAVSADEQALTGGGAPGLRLVGSVASDNLRSALLDWTRATGGTSSTTRTPVFWLPPAVSTWGRSIPFVNLARDLSSAHQMDDGTVLLARSNASEDNRRWIKHYGQAGRQPPLFDRCLAVPSRELPLSLEILLKPGSWVAVLIHSPDIVSSYPFPFGYITANPKVVDSYRHLIAESAAKADGTAAVLWTRPDEDVHRALTSIDVALGIGVNGSD
ncbi:hypothetical protein JQ597_04600 [Bradyrhizobium sp. AUGA SZCCT0177]|uniref:hypothetical protein n=1 Tax=Bradyrhizobium sp. AUGA SZCCT0177 TaxID=2807665 RepID=UPI001BAE13D4|nr:hypothetical protein [Bradyrhizobium sp. AUGA SZCCT0177]MBR1281315.1 hypothetical protein [Bradyrhizobium sp. AUGA SZCCT0177]